MIAVTGANGLLGSFIVRKLIETGLPFRAFKRATSEISHLSKFDGAIDWRVVDVLDHDSLYENLQGVTGVIHAAGMVSFDPRKRNTMLKTNVDGTRNIVNACIELQIPRLLYVSSIAALPAAPENVVTEDMHLPVGKRDAPYGDSKYQAELEVFRGQEEGLHTLVVNPSVILSAENWSRSSGRIFQYLISDSPFYVNGMMNYVDVRDAADAIVELYNSGAENEHFIINGGVIEFREFLSQAANLMGKKAPHIRVPGAILGFTVYLEALRTKLTRKEPLVTQESVRLANSPTYYDNSKVRQLLGFKFRPLESTLSWCCTHNTANGDKK